MRRRRKKTIWPQYNSKKIVNICEKCKNKKGTEVHHLQHQSEANNDDFITSSDNVFHKNNLANLMTLCNDCHNEEHKKCKKGNKRIKTTKGMQIKDI